MQNNPDMKSLWVEMKKKLLNLSANARQFILPLLLTVVLSFWCPKVLAIRCQAGILETEPQSRVSQRQPPEFGSGEDGTVCLQS